GGLHAVSGLVTYYAGGQGDELKLYDNANPLFFNYTITDTSVTRDSAFFFGGVNYSGVSHITLAASDGPNTVTVSTSNLLTVDMLGNGGNDHFFIGNGILGPVFFFFKQKTAYEITFDDHLNPANAAWLLEPNNVWVAGRVFNTNGFETV